MFIMKVFSKSYINRVLVSDLALMAFLPMEYRGLSLKSSFTKCSVVKSMRRKIEISFFAVVREGLENILLTILIFKTFILVMKISFENEIFAKRLDFGHFWESLPSLNA